MRALLNLVRHVFIAALDGDAPIAAAIGRFEGAVRLDKGEMLFTLPDLFRFVRTQAADAVPAAAAAAEVDYVSFRRALYAGNVNTELRRLGAVIVIDQGHDDHTLRLYRLIRLPD